MPGPSPPLVRSYDTKVSSISLFNVNAAQFYWLGLAADFDSSWQASAWTVEPTSEAL